MNRAVVYYSLSGNTKEAAKVKADACWRNAVNIWKET